MTLAHAVKAEARRLGFELAGITAPDPPPHHNVFERWLAAGREGEMTYLASQRARQRRGDPHLILPECRSILVLGTFYWAPEALGDGLQNGDPHPASVPPPKRHAGSPSPADTTGSSAGPNPVQDGSGAGSYGRLAAYAWGADYHEVLAERLEALVAFIEAQVGHPIPNRWYSDTGPVLERDLAQRAGLGWIGKNSCLIHPRKGSYFLLSEILLGIELEPDPPFETDHCGSCTRCLEACPTACILPDRTLDARRCLSYLTIELKGGIPAELRPRIGEWVFGCDVCQQVCPWNRRFAAPQGDSAFAPRSGVPRPDLVQELALTPEGFNQKFKGSPVKRAKRRGYLRNVAVALGNQLKSAPTPAAVEALAHTLRGDSEPLVRSHAAWALGQIGGGAAREALQAAFGRESERSVQVEIHRALEALAEET